MIKAKKLLKFFGVKPILSIYSIYDERKMTHVKEVEDMLVVVPVLLYVKKSDKIS
jgi:hypothetical protein